MSLSLSIVIPNYNGSKLLEQCITKAVEAAQHAKLEYEIIVSDDASTDDSVTLLKEKFLLVKIIESQSNHGFATNINKGIFAAKNHLVFLLNSDVELTKEYFVSQLKYFENRDTFGVMGRIEDKSGKIQDAAKYPATKGIQIIATKNFLPEKLRVQVPSFFLSGANALVNRKKLMELNGFDEIFSPFYMEDVDLSLRAWRLNWKCYYEHESLCYHATSSTINAHNKRKKVKLIAKRNKFLLHAMHLSGLHRLLWQIEIIFNFLFRWIVLDALFYKSFFAFLSKSKEVTASRKKFKDLQEKYSSELSVLSVIKTIKEKISGYQIKIF